MDNITDKEKKVVEELKKRTIKDATPKLLEDETVFYRFAKARDFNLVEAETMLRKHIAWRKEYQIDTILTEYEPPKILREYFASSFICFDKEGCIVRLQDWGRMDAKCLTNAVTKYEMAKFSAYIAEQDIAALINKGGNLRKPFFCLIYDFEELTYAKSVNMTNLQYLLYGTKTLIDNYPEGARNVIFINAPSYYAWVYNALKTILPSSITQKCRIYGTDGWKEALLENIDADDLPAYLGGNKTDPDGNPFCESFIIRGKPIPKMYFKQEGENRLSVAPDVEKLVVMPFSKKEIDFEVKEENSFLEWEYEITKGEIDFSLHFMKEISNNLENIELIPKQRINTSDVAEKGWFKCEKNGKYRIIFDNSHSWFHSKEVYYRAAIRHPNSNGLYEST